ncbi:hypothetical protein ARMSODRAFT_1040862 [Armillaria solidipes]|uniref:Uncharacterized protein n=1 Tax=Armillaria solidipes TaxID=1076256 RepID=A0A2H3BZB0_9AGAR|nr:hypothetical protein ARMSODRAFT_1040862 [Armillaria solidipes]
MCRSATSRKVTGKLLVNQRQGIFCPDFFPPLSVTSKARSKTPIPVSAPVSSYFTLRGSKSASCTGYQQLPPKFALQAISIRAQNIDTRWKIMSFEDPSEGQRRIRKGFAAGRPKKTLTQLTVQNRELPVPKYSSHTGLNATFHFGSLPVQHCL